jgi:hypothetical protein
MESIKVSARTRIERGFTLLVLAASAWSLALAEDVENKFRVGLAIGGYNNTDSINSDSANVLTLVDENQVFDSVYIDPRDDSAVFNTLDINSGPIGTLYGQYAVTKTFVIEASVGYTEVDVGNVEMQAQFIAVDIPDLQRFKFSTYRYKAGTFSRIPVQLTALARFRPRASFNPYFGGGIGYAFHGFEPSDELNTLSLNMDDSLGGQSRLTQATFGAPTLVPPPESEIGDLQGAAVNVPDTFEWHLAGGAELSFKRKWVAFLDLRWTHASQSMTISFDGGTYLGKPVPQLTDFNDSPAALDIYGASWITSGGLVDGGSIQQRPRDEPGIDPGTDCAAEPDDCENYFDFTTPDGELDPGYYYVQGGTVDYGGLALQIGVRYTF